MAGCVNAVDARAIASSYSLCGKFCEKHATNSLEIFGINVGFMFQGSGPKLNKGRCRKRCHSGFIALFLYSHCKISSEKWKHLEGKHGLLLVTKLLGDLDRIDGDVLWGHGRLDQGLALKRQAFAGAGHGV